MRFDKPIGTLLLLYPTVWTLYFVNYAKIPLNILLTFIFGVFLTRSAGCVINDFFDIKFDAQVERTKNRPLANKTLNKKNALSLFMLLIILALIIAVYNLKFMTLLVTIPALILMLTYPLMKRVFLIPQAYLGMAFSFGIIMAAIEADFPLNKIFIYLLFFANIAWVIGYDGIYAMLDIKYDKLINIKTIAITCGKYLPLVVSISYLCFIALMIIAAYDYKYNYYTYFNLELFIFGMLIVSVLLVIQIAVLFLKRESLYFKMFKLNNFVGLIILAISISSIIK